MKIYHNPRCSKSRETLSIIQEAGKKVEIINYLDTPPSDQELKAILSKLGIPAEQLLRKNELVYKEQFSDKSFSEDEWIKTMVKHPKLIERPIVIDGQKAVIGRPPEKVLALL